VFDVTLTDKYQNLSQSVNTDVTLTDKYQNLSQSVNTDVTLTDKYTILVHCRSIWVICVWGLETREKARLCRAFSTSVITNILSLNCNMKLYWCHFDKSSMYILSLICFTLNGLLITSHFSNPFSQNKSANIYIL
jgi:hypothetical protein